MSSIDISTLLKPIPFTPDKPELWFQQIEEQFWKYTITEEFMKYNYVITQLDSESMSQVHDVICSEHTSKSYNTLKSALIERLAKLKITKIKCAIQFQQCGKDKPSEFLKRLREIAGQELDEQSIKEAWVNGLPCNILWLISAELFSSPLDKLAETADDAYMVQTAITPNVTKDQENFNTKLEQLAKEVCESGPPHNNSIQNVHQDIPRLVINK